MLAELRVYFVELPYLAIGSPTQIAGAGVAQIEIGDVVDATRPVKRRSALMGDRFVVDEAVGAGRANGLVVEAHRISIAAAQAGDLRPDQRGAVLEVLRAMLRPDFELPLMGGNSVQMSLPV